MKGLVWDWHTATVMQQFQYFWFVSWYWYIVADKDGCDESSSKGIFLVSIAVAVILHLHCFPCWRNYSSVSASFFYTPIPSQTFSLWENKAFLCYVDVCASTWCSFDTRVPLLILLSGWPLLLMRLGIEVRAIGDRREYWQEPLLVKDSEVKWSVLHCSR